jgi:hypothetical protein
MRRDALSVSIAGDIPESKEVSNASMLMRDRSTRRNLKPSSVSLWLSKVKRMSVLMAPIWPFEEALVAT